MPLGVLAGAFSSSNLGYVMAHEMGHLLLPSPSHSRKGIMRSDWNRQDLTHIAAGVMQFTAPEAKLIRSKASACCHQ